MSGPDWQKIAKELVPSDKERVAVWMIQHGFATGHGDTLDDLLGTLSWQVEAEKKIADKFLHDLHAMSMEEPERLELLGALAECAQNKADLKALIIELCNALEEEFGESRDLMQSQQRPWNIIQRAREATR